MALTLPRPGLTADQFRGLPAAERERYVALMSRRAELQGRPPVGRPWPGPPQETLRRYFPDDASAPLGAHHHEFWDHLWGVQPGVRTRPVVMIVNRAGAKTTTAEMAVVLLGAFRRRKYILYVRATQSKANEAVGVDIAKMMTSPRLVADVPEMAESRAQERRVGAGLQHVFTQSRVRARGLLVDAVGLDTAVRGMKYQNLRPDTIIVDDVDAMHESLTVIKKNRATLAQSIIPAGSNDVLVVFIENIPNPQAISASLTWPEKFAEEDRFLLDRKLIGPVPAVDGLEVAQVPHPDNPGERMWEIVAGRPTWSGFDLAAAQQKLNLSNLRAFLIEYQHEQEPPEGRVFSHIEFVEVDFDDVPWGDLVDRQVWVDPATSDQDGADAMGIQAVGVTAPAKGRKWGRVYALWSWEQRSTPTDALERAILKAYELGASTVGVETDNGGDAWLSVAREALRNLVDDDRVPKDFKPRFDTGKAGVTGRSKFERLTQLIQPLETGGLVLVRGSTAALKRALVRYSGMPESKPWDLLDAAWWGFDAVTKRSGHKMRSGTAAKRRRPQFEPSGYQAGGARRGG